MNQLLSACGEATSRPIAGIPPEIYWDALLRTAWWTGLRRGTLFKLRRSDVDVTTGWLTVGPEIFKNRRGAKFRLGQDAVDAIGQLCLFQPKEKLLFPWPCNLRTVNRQFERNLLASGLPKSKRGMGHFHKIRRSTATKVRMSGRRSIGLARCIGAR